MTPLVTPLEVRLVLTREAAKVLGCSMRQVRTLAARDKIKSWTLGLKSFAYDLEDLKRYKVEKEAERKAGTCRGTPPKGFSPYVSPPNPKKK
jgi:hypothetical protein